MPTQIKTRPIRDAITMFGRSLRTTIRQPDTLVTGMFVPVLVMLLFVYVFGGAMNMGDYSVINFIVPGIILQVLGQCSTNTAIGINTDVHKGMIDRFRSMPISKSALLNGHMLAALLRNLVTAALIIATAILIGFRPEANVLEWLAIAGMLALYILVLTWLAVIVGLISRNAESAAGGMMLAFILPYISSGFVPTETLPTALRVFAEHQPMTPIINTLRSLMLGRGLGDDIWLALVWCVGILVVAYFAAVQIYKRKMTK